ncbi:NUDIX domain-containing protein [Candidatus Bipolaricaulota sp. J31]
MHLYLETDGRIYTVRRYGLLDLPRVGDPIPFPYRILYELPWGDEGVAVGVPLLEAHPTEWINKDEIPSREDVSPILREAVHRTMPRVVAEGIIERGEELLLVKAARGFTAGLWSLPGGFLFFGESPAEAVRREVEEELGVGCSVGELLGVRAKVGEHTGLHWIIFFFAVELHGDPKPDPDEIAEARFFPKKEAAMALADGTMAAFIRDHYRL